MQGCSFGYFVGGWGKPPVDETGRPLYGDVFGLESHDTAAKEVEQDVDKEMWGELEPEEESSEEEEVSELCHWERCRWGGAVSGGAGGVVLLVEVQVGWCC